MIAIFVTIQVKPEFSDSFVEATLDDARGSVADEPGCFRFDMLQDDSDANRIHLYEVYADQAALEAHRQAPHYLRWRSAVSGWFDGPTKRTEGTTVFPADDGWRRQKPHLAG